MQYMFPVAGHIDDYLSSIAGRDEFAVRRDPVSGIIVLNYIFQTADTFADLTTIPDDPMEQRRQALRRECRGITFDLESGDIVSRKYHKFFNVGQRTEVASYNIPWDQPHWVLDKLDGSMLTPFTRRDGTREWHTKMGRTEVSEPVIKYVASCPLPYDRFTDTVREGGGTPIFEWCSRTQRIVLDYPHDALVLTAIRDNVTGVYMLYPDMVDLAAKFGIPVVEAMDARIEDPQDFLQRSADIEGLEGYVVRWDSGHMAKVKGNWYVRIHRTNDGFNQEKDVWQIVLDDMLDDAKPMLAPELLEAAEGFEAALVSGIMAAAQRLTEAVATARQRLGDDRKRFALEVATNLPPIDRSVMFAIWGGGNAAEVIKAMLRKRVGSQTGVDDVRGFVGGVRWDQFWRPRQIDVD